jgi:Membrane transport protein
MLNDAKIIRNLKHGQSSKHFFCYFKFQPAPKIATDWLFYQMPVSHKPAYIHVILPHIPRQKRTSQLQTRQHKRIMITLQDIYTVLCATTPLYFAMLTAYFSVKKWKLFTLVQCTGISRFVSAFAVPVLSFHFISQNDPFLMDFRFILADTISKILVLVVLSIFGSFFRCSGTTRLDWVITIFSVTTLPNTLVMGIPLLHAMYGEFTEGLMVQLIVLQCIVW